MILAPLLLAAAVVPPEQAVNDAAQGLQARIEDEDRGDTALRLLRAEGCTVTLEGEDHAAVLDLRDVSGLGLAEPGSLAIARPGGITALVADDEKPQQVVKLGELSRALGDLYRKCGKK